MHLPPGGASLQHKTESYGATNQQTSAAASGPSELRRLPTKLEKQTSTYLEPWYLTSLMFYESIFSYNLRPHPHGFLFPSKDDRNFISRLLYKDMY